MNISKNINYISASLTFRCGLGCSYCINNQQHSGINRKTSEITGKEWVNFLNTLVLSNDLPVTLEGGEPSLHNDFYYIIDNVVHPINILTNLTFDVDEFIRNVDTRKVMKSHNRAFKSIRISYHSKYMNADELVYKAYKLQEAGFTVGIFGLNDPTAMNDNILMAEKCRKNQIYFYVKDFLGYYNDVLHGVYRYKDAIFSPLKSCKCRPTELLIAPDGKIYRCHRDMYVAENNVCDINEHSAIENWYSYKQCVNFGGCNPCDIKLKSNRFLNGGNSSVDICGISSKDLGTSNKSINITF